MKTILKKLLFSLAISLILSVMTVAQEPETPTGESNTAGQVNTDTTPAVSEQAPADTFTPTETISEDLSVPFPVDI